MKKTWSMILWIVLLVPMLVPGYRQVALATCRSMADLIEQGAYVVADRQGRIIDGCNADQPLVPASVLKIATISSALAILGAEYRFRTEFFLDPPHNLFIKGYGDPTLVSEEIACIAEHLLHQGVRRIDRVYIDPTAFALEHQVPGREESDNPYDAPVGPFSVNFNAVPLIRETSGRIVSGEAQTPTLPLMEELGGQYPAGQHRINICAKGGDADQRMARYGGELVAALLRDQGIAVRGYGGLGRVPARGRLVYTHQSRQSVREISHSTLKYSSNFMANLLFLACGSRQFGYPATWAKARQAVHQELTRQLGTDVDAIVQVEGAGLSRENQVTAEVMLRLLEVFRPQITLLNREQDVMLKTGTLTGVYNLAGYLPGGQSFVILLNQPANNREAVLARIKDRFAGAIPTVNKQPVVGRSRTRPEK